MAYSVNPNDFVMQLNNLLQAQGRLNTLSWRESAAGPAHGPEWTIAALSTLSILSASDVRTDDVISCSRMISVNGQEYGWGTHRTKQGARHEAARKTLQNLAMLDMVDD
ncbi:hypothetical protein FRC12_024302 [Ceratobasidium sp. 428]|nr:hypothetical protein FRC09_006242 [Ceratobasidium sp. 395]KAG8779399.1 hypothetical protein FRC12_024302 [Ceratobasidium sp. 428]